jgi:hypothetical protein
MTWRMASAASLVPLVQRQTVLVVSRNDRFKAHTMLDEQNFPPIQFQLLIESSIISGRSFGRANETQR